MDLAAFVVYLPYLCLLACPLVMGIMLWMMSRNAGGRTDHTAPLAPTPADQLAVLSTQRQAPEELRALTAPSIIADATHSAPAQG